MLNDKCLPSSTFFLLQQLILIGPSQVVLIIIIWNLKCWRLPKWFPLEDKRAIPLTQLYRWKEINFGQSIWDKRVLLLSREHLEEHINWELGDWFGNLMRTHWEPPKKFNKGCVTHTVALPFTFKKYLKTKEELWKLKYFTMQKYNLQKNYCKRNQNPSRYYYNSIITNLKFQHKTKISSFKKSSHKNRPIIIT